MRDITTVEVGEKLEVYVIDSVDRERMKTLAALYDDPNPIHFDLPATIANGMGDKLINQGPVNIAYLLEPAILWAGDRRAVREFDVQLLGNVFAEDRVESGGTVTEVDEVAGTVTIELSAAVDGRPVIEGTATLSL